MVLITISKRRAGYPQEGRWLRESERLWNVADGFVQGFVAGGGRSAARCPARRTIAGGDGSCGTRLLIKILMRSDSVLEV